MIILTDYVYPVVPSHPITITSKSSIDHWQASVTIIVGRRSRLPTGSIMLLGNTTNGLTTYVFVFCFLANVIDLHTLNEKIPFAIHGPLTPIWSDRPLKRTHGWAPDQVLGVMRA